MPTKSPDRMAEDFEMGSIRRGFRERRIGQDVRAKVFDECPGADAAARPPALPPRARASAAARRGASVVSRASATVRPRTSTASASASCFAVFVRAVVRVHEYPDGTIAVFLGPHRLADYGPDGTIATAEQAA
jgi:hypothetical protein